MQLLTAAWQAGIRNASTEQLAATVATGADDLYQKGSIKKCVMKIESHVGASGALLGMQTGMCTNQIPNYSWKQPCVIA